MRRQRSGVEDRWFRADGERTTRHGIGKLWRARYVDERSREHSQMFARKIDAQQWLDGQVASVVGGRHVAPADAQLTVSQWSAIWLAGYKINRTSTVREAKHASPPDRGGVRSHGAVGGAAIPCEVVGGAVEGGWFRTELCVCVAFQACSGLGRGCH